MNGTKLPLVSVVIPVYNAELFLTQAVDSVLGQTYGNIEIILVDDCSQDGSRQIMKAYADRDRRIHLLFNDKNRGVAQTRNIGIQAAAGEYIALLDSDDIWIKSKLEKQISLMQEKRADVGYGSMDLIDEDGKKIKTFFVPSTTNYQEMLTRCYFSCSTVVIRASLLKTHLFREDFYHEDYLLWLEMLALNVTAVGVSDVVAYYRQIRGSRSHGKMKAAINRWRIYRDALEMDLFKCIKIFIRYAIEGVKKYYLQTENKDRNE